MDPVSMAFEALALGFKLYNDLSEADQQAVLASLKQTKADTAKDGDDLKETVDQVKAERDQVLALLQQTHQAVAAAAAHPDMPSSVADVLNGMASQLADRFSQPFTAKPVVTL